MCKFKIQSPLVLLVAASLGAGCSHPRRVDPMTTPTFGSSPALSTAAGFIAGKWMRHVELGSGRHGILGSFNASQKHEIEFLPAGLLKETINGYHGLGRWEEAGNGVAVQVDTIDGKTPEQIQADYTQYNALVAADNRSLAQLRATGIRRPNLYAGHASTSHRDWMERWNALNLAQEASRLELYSDNRQLYCPPRVGTDHTSSLGTVLFVRDAAKG
jgi:hypothetical protein